MMTRLETPTPLSDPRHEGGGHHRPSSDAAGDAATAWCQREERKGTLIDSETLWREAHLRYASILSDLPDDDAAPAWAALVSRLVFDFPKVPRNERDAAAEVAALLDNDRHLPFADRAKAVHEIAARRNVEPSKTLGLMGPGVAYPWMFSRALWNPAVVAQGLEALLAPFEWEKGDLPDTSGLVELALRAPLADAVSALRNDAKDNSDLDRMLAAVASLAGTVEAEGKDVGVVEPCAFVDALAGHGLSPDEVQRLRPALCVLRDAVVLLGSCCLYFDAERSIFVADLVREHDPDEALGHTRRAANIYKRLAVAQRYPERILERHQQISREIEEIRPTASEPDNRSDHVLLVSTFNSPTDLQRLLLSVAHELMAFAWGRGVHVIISDDSTPVMRQRNCQIIDDFVQAGMSISHWDIERKCEYLDQLNREVFPDGSFDVHDLAGVRKDGEKAIPYGRFRNFLRLVALKEVRERGLDEPVLTWLDQDNELGALVLTKGGKLAKRHVFNYFEQKSELFLDDDLLVGGGGYTNDALEGVEKFWVAWGILHSTLELAQHHDPHGPPLLPADPDITRFRPWDQPDTLERLPREGEGVATLADQVVLLLTTLLGTFRGKYDNQVQIYHPWTFGHVEPDDEHLVEEHRAFAGMPGGNTTFATEALRSPTPFITVGGRGEDIFHLWQLEATHGVGTVCLTHTPALHTRNVRSGRSDLMGEIIDSYNGRILREPPLLWGALSKVLAGHAYEGPDEALRVQSAAAIENLRAEAKSRISEVSAFAAALEPYLDAGSDSWWVHNATGDPRLTEILGELRPIVDQFKDAARYHAEADEKLFGLDDVEELTEKFVAAYPHWKTVAAYVGGEEASSPATTAAAVSPSSGYGQTLLDVNDTRTAGPARGRVEPPLGGEPLADPPWHEVMSGSLSLFRRFETGRAQSDSVIDWAQRLERLGDIYRHYLAVAGDVPDFVWTKLYRDALLIPYSPSYAAVTKLLSAEFWDLPAAGREMELDRIASEFGVDRDLLSEAVSGGACGVS